MATGKAEARKHRLTEEIFPDLRTTYSAIKRQPSQLDQELNSRLVDLINEAQTEMLSVDILYYASIGQIFPWVREDPHPEMLDAWRAQDQDKRAFRNLGLSLWNRERRSMPGFVRSMECIRWFESKRTSNMFGTVLLEPEYSKGLRREHVRVLLGEDGSRLAMG